MTKYRNRQRKRAEDVYKRQGVNWHEDQFQVIAGNEVNAVYKALEDKGVPTDDAPAANSDSSKSVVSKVIDAITGCMTPMIPALTAACLLYTSRCV